MESPDDDLNNSGRARRPRVTAAVSKNKTQEKRPKKRKAEVSVEVLYRQENYKEVCPTALETIFESPRNANRKSSGRERRKRESSKGCDNENFGSQRVKRFCQFGCYYYPTKQKESIRKSRAKKLEKKGIKIPKGGVITNEDVQAALANLSDEENDITINESFLNSTRNTTIDPNDLFDFKTPTKQGYKKTKEEDTSMFYSGNIIKPCETSDALMDDTLKNMMKNMDLDELKDIKLPFADESNELENDDVALKIPDFFDANTTLGFESKVNKSSRRRSGRVTDARNSGIFMPLIIQETNEGMESDTKEILENDIIPDNNHILIESDQDNALEGRISRRGRASNSLIKYDAFFEEKSPMTCTSTIKKSRRRSGRVDIMKNINISLITKDEENKIKEDTEIGHNECNSIKDSVISTENKNESLPVDTAVENINMVNNIKKPENGIRRGRMSNAASQYTAFFEEVSPIASNKKVKKSRRLLDEIQDKDIKLSPEPELHQNPIVLIGTVINEPQEMVEDDNTILESDLIDTTKPTIKKRRGRPSARGKRRVSGVKRPLYRKIVDSSLSSPNSSVGNSTDTSLQTSANVGSIEALIKSPCALMAELTLKSPSSETLRGSRRSPRRSTRRSMSSNQIGNTERIVESENVLASKQENKKTSEQKSNLSVPLNMKRTSSKELKSNDVTSIQISSAISSEDSSDVKKSSTEEIFRVTNGISTEEISGSICGKEEPATNKLDPEGLSKLIPTAEGNTPTGSNNGESLGEIKKIKLSDVLIGSKKGKPDKSKRHSSKTKRESTMGKSLSGSLGEKVEFNEQFCNETTNSPIISGIFDQKTSIRMGKLYRNKENIVKD